MSLQAELRLRRGALLLDVHLRVPAEGVTVIFGPSGCGKTTLLRALAGLDSDVEGHVSLSGVLWHEGQRVLLPAHQRGIGFVFQESRLFSHLSVRGNLDYAARRVSGGAERPSLSEAAELMGISPLLERGTDSLSGGERQRVAIARAALAARSLLILDEPLAALDAAAREELLPRIGMLRRRLRVPMVYVTHAVDEAARFADEMVYMEEGRIVATGAAESVLTRLDLPLARRPDAESIIRGGVRTIEPAYGLAVIETPIGDVRVAAGSLSPRDPVRIRMLARDVSIALERPLATSILNVFPVQVADIQTEGEAAALVALESGGVRFLARLTRRSVDHLALKPGLPVYAQVKSVAVLS